MDMDFEARIKQFEPVTLSEPTPPIDTSFADSFLKAFTRMAKAQMKTQQSVAMSADEVKQFLEKQDALITEVKSQRDTLRMKNEQLIRFLLEVVDLIVRFHTTTEENDNPEMASVARTMYQALERHMEKVGLARIPALGDVPDALYHYVLDVRTVEKSADKDHIVEVVREGYTLSGTVLRKADVIVGK